MYKFTRIKDRRSPIVNYNKHEKNVRKTRNVLPLLTYLLTPAEDCSLREAESWRIQLTPLDPHGVVAFRQM